MKFTKDDPDRNILILIVLGQCPKESLDRTVRNRTTASIQDETIQINDNMDP